jgi:hypothetical protein
MPPCTPSPTDCTLTAVLTSEHPSLTSAPTFLRSMNAKPLFKQGEPSHNVLALLACLQLADPNSSDFNEDNMGVGWGHYLFTAGGFNVSSLTAWQDVGSIAIVFKLVAAALKTCQEARLMCAKTGMSTMSGFVSDTYLEKTLNALETCWVGAGGVSDWFSFSLSPINCLFLGDHPSPYPATSFHTFLL